MRAADGEHLPDAGLRLLELFVNQIVKDQLSGRPA